VRRRTKFLLTESLVFTTQPATRIVTTLINIMVALAVCAWLLHLQRRRTSFSLQVFTGMVLGVLLGAAMHLVYGVESPVIKSTSAYLDIVGAELRSRSS
jgi:L-cystine uptake protein TcyP (sodium:dicarboxylate symporter family)